MSDLDRVYDALNEYARERTAEIEDARRQIENAAEMVRRAYVALLAMDHKSQWPARLTNRGQGVLCDLRGALAALTGDDLRTIQEDAEAEAVKAICGIAYRATW